MIQVRLPDGSERQFAQPITVAEFAKSIGPGLAKAALAGKVNGELVDTSYVIESDASVAIVTGKDSEGLDLIRHYNSAPARLRGQTALSNSSSTPSAQ